jgi:hypothetical protein
MEAGRNRRLLIRTRWLRSSNFFARLLLPLTWFRRSAVRSAQPTDIGPIPRSEAQHFLRHAGDHGLRQEKLIPGRR